MVEPLGIEVLMVTDSREAARRLQSEKYDGIILDAYMPHLDGFELSKQVRTMPLNRTVPIAMITGHDDIQTMRRSFQAGVTFFLGKPITTEKMYGLLKVSRGAMLREKRRFARLPLRTLVDCRVGEKHFKATSVNIGEGGKLLEKPEVLEAGQEVELRFTMPKADSALKAHAIVQRHEPPHRTAVRFLDISTEDSEAIQTYISGSFKG
jgi:CheY-like chemotaxis protein